MSLKSNIIGFFMSHLLNMFGRYELEEFEKTDNKTQKITDDFFKILESDKPGKDAKLSYVMRTIKNAYICFKKISDIIFNVGSIIFLIISFCINEVILPIVTAMDTITKLAKEYVIIAIGYLRLLPRFLAVFKEKFIEALFDNAFLIALCIFLTVIIFYKSKQQKENIKKKQEPQLEVPQIEETQLEDPQIVQNFLNGC
jgi:hypothetical protein